jgi:hypothetical protein
MVIKSCAGPLWLLTAVLALIIGGCTRPPVPKPAAPAPQPAPQKKSLFGFGRKAVEEKKEDKPSAPASEEIGRAHV